MRCEVVIPTALFYGVVTDGVRYCGLSVDDAICYAIAGCGKGFQWYVIEEGHGFRLTIHGSERAIAAALPMRYYIHLKDEGVLGDPYEDTVADPRWKPQRMGQVRKAGAFARY